MKTMELNDLEVQIHHLIHVIERLKNENRSLRNKLNANARKQMQLAEINQTAILKVKRIIGQLKEELS